MSTRVRLARSKLDQTHSNEDGFEMSCHLYGSITAGRGKWGGIILPNHIPLLSEFFSQPGSPLVAFRLGAQKKRVKGKGRIELPFPVYSGLDPMSIPVAAVIDIQYSVILFRIRNETSYKQLQTEHSFQSRQANDSGFYPTQARNFALREFFEAFLFHCLRTALDFVEQSGRFHTSFSRCMSSSPDNGKGHQHSL